MELKVFPLNFSVFYHLVIAGNIPKVNKRKLTEEDIINKLLNTGSDKFADPDESIYPDDNFHIEASVCTHMIKGERTIPPRFRKAVAKYTVDELAKSIADLHVLRLQESISCIISLLKADLLTLGGRDRQEALFEELFQFPDSNATEEDISNKHLAYIVKAVADFCEVASNDQTKTGIKDNVKILDAYKCISGKLPPRKLKEYVQHLRDILTRKQSDYFVLLLILISYHTNQKCFWEPINLIKLAKRNKYQFELDKSDVGRILSSHIFRFILDPEAPPDKIPERNPVCIDLLGGKCNIKKQLELESNSWSKMPIHEVGDFITLYDDNCVQVLGPILPDKKKMGGTVPQGKTSNQT